MGPGGGFAPRRGGGFRTSQEGPLDQASRLTADGLRQFLDEPADTPPAALTAAMLGAHAQVLSAAELSVALRTAEATRTDVRAALW